MTMTDDKPPRDALANLNYHWGDAYAVVGAADCWMARRRDNGRLLNASSPDRLRELMIADYQAQPVPREAAL